VFSSSRPAAIRVSRHTVHHGKIIEHLLSMGIMYVLFHSLIMFYTLLIKNLIKLIKINKSKN